jgi:histidyl-tRNA synthetase
VIDKLDKIGGDAVVEALTDPAGDVQLAPVDARQVVDWLGLRDLEAAADGLPPDAASRAQLAELFDWLDAYGVADRVEFDTSIVRGLAYYTGTVFEAFDTRRSLRAICGGGRYDRLLETLGGPALPAVGFGFGDVVILELLQDLGVFPELPRDLEAVVFAFGDAERPAAIQLAAELRAAGQQVEMVLSNAKLKRVLADANRSGARRVYLVGPEEVAQGAALVRDLASGEQSRHPLPRS